MGTVLGAEDVALRRPVALKVMNPDLASDPVNGWQRFAREARALAAIKHPNLVTVYQVGHEGDAVYLAMERLERQTLAARILRLSRSQRRRWWASAARSRRGFPRSTIAG